MYPRIGSHHGNPAVVPGAGRSSSFHHTGPPASSSAGLGIRVAVKPEYRITPPPQLLPQMEDVPRSNFHYEFDFEKKVVAELEKDSPDWNRLGLENLPSRSSEAPPPSGPAGDPIINKYISSGLSREAVPLAVANYGDNPTKVREFVNGYTRLREMGFSSSSIAEALVKNYNNMDEALAYFLNGSS
ncbi:hypothetical protein BT93_A2171 [Corymbia citriodora subsp. variegata]|nr:hypothetical protein BT93_A2171 [Corymbia citriodora subsp. variegata]